ncbi:MAG TPA: ComF family protein [Candidatus Acidoferrum sp.]|nr:ComF family protein [Candidatus Acidoferrum sp.]
MADGNSSSGTAAARRGGVRGGLRPGWGWLAEASDAIVSVFFPAGCRICDRLLTSASRVPICGECLSSFKRVPSIVCEVCGRPLPGLTREPEQPLLCPACGDKTYAFDRARSFAVYEDAVVRAILLLKFEQIEPLGAWFAERLAEVVNAEGDRLAADVVVPVPLHRERERERGYNQAALLSKPLARRLRLPHKAVLLMRTRARPDKQVLSLEERWESVRGAFATRPGSQVDNLRVLLVDDVLTTGATLDACARALRTAGAKSVIGLTVARAVRNPLPSTGEW